MKKKLIRLVLLGVIVGAVIAYTQYNKPHRNIAEEKADFSLSANELFDAFENDEKASNQKYLDKVITVTGNVMDVDKNQEGKSVVTLEAENAMMGGVICTLDASETTIEIDAETSLKCRCTGFLSDVIMIDCTVEK